MSMAPSSLWTEAGPPGDLALVWIVVVGDNHTRIVFLVIIVDVTAAAVAIERISLVRVVRHEDGGTAVAVTIAKTALVPASANRSTTCSRYPRS